MAVNISGGDGHLMTGVPSTLFHLNVPSIGGFFGQDYDVSADGQRFLVNEVVGPASEPGLTVVVNWPALLKETR
jgi:hypothetical protein